MTHSIHVWVGYHNFTCIQGLSKNKQYSPSISRPRGGPMTQNQNIKHTYISMSYRGWVIWPHLTPSLTEMATLQYWDTHVWPRLENHGTYFTFWFFGSQPYPWAVLMQIVMKVRVDRSFTVCKSKKMKKCPNFELHARETRWPNSAAFWNGHSYGS